MADDIVTRLRKSDRGYCPICQERLGKHLAGCVMAAAADEIEQLRGEINSMASAQAGWGRVARLEAEIERLRLYVEELRSDRYEWVKKSQRQEEEIQHLTRDRDAWREDAVGG